jgi:hypothetical protein
LIAYFQGSILDYLCQYTQVLFAIWAIATKLPIKRFLIKKPRRNLFCPFPATGKYYGKIATPAQYRILWVFWGMQLTQFNANGVRLKNINLPPGAVWQAIYQKGLVFTNQSVRYYYFDF